MTRENLIVLFYSLPVYQLLYYAIQLITFRKNNLSGRYLGLLLLAMTLFLSMNTAINLGHHFLLVQYLFVPLLLTLLPFGFLYLHSLFRKNDQIKGFGTYILFLPAAMFLTAVFIDFVFSGFMQHTIFFKDIDGLFSRPGTLNDISLNILHAGLLIVVTAQIVFSILRMTNLFKTEEDRKTAAPEYLPHIRLHWVKMTSVSLVIFTSACTLQFLIPGLSDIYSAAIFNTLVLISGGLTGYYGMKQDAIMQKVSVAGTVKPLNVARNTDRVIKPKMDISDDEVAEIIARMEILMMQQKPYLIKSYTINDLCMHLEVKRHRLTIIINDEMGTNFNSLINNYRIREATRLLEDNAHNYTIDAIADMAGFRSRSSFYASFKKITGLTPKEYLSKSTGRVRKTGT